MRTFKYLTFVDGLFFALMVSSTESYALYYHAQKGLDGIELGLVATFPILAASLTQLILPRLVPNDKLGIGLIITLLIQFISVFGIIITTDMNAPFWYLICFLSLYWIGGQNAGLLWMDFTSHFFDKFEYSKYLASRNTFVTFSTMFFYLFFSFFLGESLPYKTLFIIGAFARFISIIINIYLVFKFKFKSKSTSEVTPESEDMRKIEKKVIKRFFVWGGFFRLTANISSPFFLTYMIKNLQLSTPSYVWLSAIPFLGRALFLRNWERASQEGRIYYGIQIAAIFISFLPFGWTISNVFAYLVFLQILSGMFWGGMELTQVLMIQQYGHGNTRKLLGIQQAIFTFMGTIGAMIGGGLIELNLNFDDIFRISTMGRLIVAFGLIYNMRFFGLSKLSFKIGKNFLYTVLSIRPSPANTGRTLPISSEGLD